MNSEELEVSLRTEFEHYLSGVRAEMKQRLASFQQKIEGEFEKHKSQVDEAIQDFSKYVESENAIDEVLKESVVEHLRLARDDGARIAASAAAAAEELGLDGNSSKGFNLIRDAVADISRQTSQSAILKSLIDHSSHFTNRGAFFIIKNEQFIGWQVFGDHEFSDGDVVRNIKFSVSADTILTDAVRDLATTRAAYGAHSDDKKFLDILKFGRPQDMVAIPLIARGRGVAVLYADPGEGEGVVNTDALEALVRVAGLTVELLASSQVAEAAPADAKPSYAAPESEAVPEAPETVSTAYSTEPAEYTDNNYEEQAVTEVESDTEVEHIDVEPQHVVAEVVPVEYEDPSDDEAYLMTEPVEEVIAADDFEVERASTGFESAGSPEDSDIQHVDVEYTNGSQAVNGNGNGNGHVETAAPAVEEAPAQTSPEISRLSTRKIDLPIEVAEDERRLHTDARRFARLLVSEIKLYNEKQVKEGREAKDLYDRLRDSIDRSREMYAKRVQEPVTSKFDYFHYELVTGLAEGDEGRLGNNYPGAAA